MQDIRVTGPERRRVLLAALGAPVLLGGCSLRLERDAPAVPGLRTQDPHPDSRRLLDVLAQVQALAVQAEEVSGSASVWPAQLVRIHRAQIARLVDLMATLGISVPSVAGSAAATSVPGVSTTPPPTPTTGPAGGDQEVPPPPTSTGSTAAPPSLVLLARAEAATTGGASLAQAWSATAPNRAMLLALGAARNAAADVLGDPGSLPGGTAPGGPAGLRLLAVVRAAVHGLEVAAARTPADRREQVTTAAGHLYGMRSQLEQAAGSGAPPDRSRYPLPLPVSDATSAVRLVRELLIGVVGACATQVEPVAALGAGPQQWLLRSWSHVVADAWRHGAPGQPFPGLTG